LEPLEQNAAKRRAFVVRSGSVCSASVSGSFYGQVLKNSWFPGEHREIMMRPQI